MALATTHVFPYGTLDCKWTFYWQKRNIDGICKFLSLLEKHNFIIQAYFQQCFQFCKEVD
jgi:hypothetical protein